MVPRAHLFLIHLAWLIQATPVHRPVRIPVQHAALTLALTHTRTRTRTRTRPRARPKPTTTPRLLFKRRRALPVAVFPTITFIRTRTRRSRLQPGFQDGHNLPRQLPHEHRAVPLAQLFHHAQQPVFLHEHAPVRVDFARRSEDPEEGEAHDWLAVSPQEAIGDAPKEGGGAGEGDGNRVGDAGHFEEGVEQVFERVGFGA